MNILGLGLATINAIFNRFISHALKIALANLQTIVIVLRQWEALFKTEPLSNQSKSI